MGYSAGASFAGSKISEVSSNKSFECLAFNIESAQMTGSSKLSEASEDRPRAHPSYSWWMEILWGLGIGVLLGGAGVAVIFLDRMRLIPSWVFGWVSSDREAQKHQFRVALYGLFALWVATRLVKLGLFGGIARTTYNRAFSKLTIPQSKPDREAHARICAIKNTRVAAFLVGFFTLEVFLSWRELGKPFVEDSLYDLLFRMVLWSIVLFPVLFRVSRCLPERFILGIVMIRTVTGWVFEYAPNVVDAFASLVRQCNLVLYILGLLTSLGLLVSSFSSPKSTSYS